MQRNAATPRQGRATIKDVARLAGVDISLVSRVVNNHPKASASEATRRRILAAVETLGYEANPAARGLASSRTNTLALLLPDLSNPMYASIIRGVDSRATAHGYNVFVASRAEAASEEAFSRLLNTGPVDGLLVASGLHPDRFLRRITSTGHGPVVLVNRRVRGVKATVSLDDARGSRAAVEHLAELGHVRVTGLFGPDEVETSVRRRKGFEVACRDLGVAFESRTIASWDMRSGYEAALEVCADDKRPTAIFASTFAIGIGVLRAARESGVSVPRSLSVIALHDSDLAEYLAPPLSVVAMPAEEMGARAVDLLLNLIEGGSARNVVVRTAPTLTLRQSTARPGRSSA